MGRNKRDERTVYPICLIVVAFRQRRPQLHDRPRQVGAGHSPGYPAAEAVNQRQAAGALKYACSPRSGISQCGEARTDRVGLGLEQHASTKGGQHARLHVDAHGLADVATGILHDQGDLGRVKNRLVVSQQFVLTQGRGGRRDGHHPVGAGVLRCAGMTYRGVGAFRADADDRRAVALAC